MSYNDVKSYYQKKNKRFFWTLISEQENDKLQSKKINDIEIKSAYFFYVKEEIPKKIYLVVEILASIISNNSKQEKKYKITTEVNDFFEIKQKGNNTIEECDSLEFYEPTFYEEYLLQEWDLTVIQDFGNAIYSVNLLRKIGISDIKTEVKKLSGMDNIKYRYEKLPDDVRGRIYFKDGDLKFVDQNGTQRTEKIKKNTIVINSNYDNDEYYEFIITHEQIHLLMHSSYFRIRSMLENDNLKTLDAKFDAKFDVSQIFKCSLPSMDETLTNKQKADWMVEWQANMLALCACIPSKFTINNLNKILEKSESQEHILEMPQLMEKEIKRLASKYRVPVSFVKYRLMLLGYDMALGTFISVNNQKWDPIYFPKDTLDEGQTFIIDKQNLEKVCLDNVHLKEALDTGKLIYLGYVVAKNEKKYVERINTDSEREKTGYGYRLTDYGKAHADECCIKFFKEEKEKFLGITYNKNYLNADFSAESATHHIYSSSFEDNQSEEDLLRNSKKFMCEVKKIIEEKKSQEYQKLEDFSDYLKYHMKKKDISISELADRTYLSETTIKKYRKGVTPTFRNLMAIFIGLNLHAEFCLDMMNVSGHQFIRNNLEHILFQKLIRDHTDGNIAQWNRILKCNGYSEIPDKRGQKGD